MAGNDMRKRYAVYMILIGIAVIALEYKVDTGISYGFVIGENEGVSAYAITQLVTSYVGRYLSIDIFFNPVGYGLIIGGFMLFGKSSQGKRGIALSVAGICANLLEMFIPMVFEPESIAVPVIVLHLVQIGAVVGVMYGLAGTCTKKIDNYKYMHIGKDLRFGAELYGTCLVIGKVLYLFTRMNWYFSHILYVIVTAAGFVAVGYYIVKVCVYLKQIEMIEDKE